VDLPGRKVYARIWENGSWPPHSPLPARYRIDDNSPVDRQLTARLYSSDLEVRISQEILLGMGGVQALRLLGYDPVVWHMNEGHSAFLAVERIREFVKTGLSFTEAADKVKSGNIFTTHTPVPAGNDMFPLWLIDKYFSQVWAELGMTRDQFIDLGRQAQPWGETFVMPVLALKLSERANAVSELHSHVSRQMWNFMWPDRKEENVPIGYVTNGVHTRSWLGRRMGLLFDEYLGPDWIEHIDDVNFWEEVNNIPDADLWGVRRHFEKINWFNLPMNNVNTVRTGQNSCHHSHPNRLRRSLPRTLISLTIVSQPRFATYKRANSCFRDFNRLMRLITNPYRPVADRLCPVKAHPPV
jgi:starch phosphorylase